VRTYRALSHLPCCKHAKQAQEETVTRHAVALVTLVCPHMRWLDGKVESSARPVDSIAVYVVFLVQ
jgi:hypothetical protein